MGTSQNASAIKASKDLDSQSSSKFIKRDTISSSLNDTISYQGLKSNNTHSKSKKKSSENSDKDNESSSETSENDSKNESKTEEKEEETTATKKNSTASNNTPSKVPIKFVWRHGGDRVQMTGDFLGDFKIFVNLTQSTHDSKIWEYQTCLSPKEYTFYFKVNGRKTISKNYPRVTNGDTIHNYIDLRTYKQDNEEEEKNFEIKKNNERKKTKIKQEKNKYKFGEYGYYKPPSEAMFPDATPTPFFYGQIFNIDYLTRQHKLKVNKDYLKYSEKNLMSENNSYKIIMRLPFVNYCHLLTDKKNNCEKNSYLRLSCTENKKHKGLSYVYYVPNKKGMFDNDDFKEEEEEDGYRDDDSDES